MEKFDYGIIGGGPAGYTAGMLLAKRGFSVVLFEKNLLGGTCLNRGCIPTKLLLHASEIYKNINDSENIGVTIDNMNLDFSKILEKRDKTVEKIRKSLELAVKNSGVKTIYEEACIDNNLIKTKTATYNVNKIIVATGSKPKELKDLKFDKTFILNSDDILKLNKLPRSVLIVGSGAIGIEWARILSNFDVQVSIVEMADRLTPIADMEVSKRIERIFKQKKIKFYLNDYVKEINNKIAILSSGEKIAPDFILVAVGRDVVCPECEAFKIGDACGEIQLAHYAIHQAKSLATGIEFDKNLVPSIIYGEPEIAWVGIREQDIGDGNYKIVKLPITALGKAWCDDCTDGFMKLIIQNEVIKGAHIVSKEASSLIHIVLLAMQNSLSVDVLRQMCYAHPTYAEGIFDLVMNA